MHISGARPAPRALRAAAAVLALAAPFTADVRAAGPPWWTRYRANPVLVPGQRYPDGRFDRAVADPTVLYDESEGLWKLWYASSRGATFTGEGELILKYAESPDGKTWRVAEAPVFQPSGVAGEWDSTHVETPSVVIDPAAPAERRFLLWYAGASYPLSADFNDYQIGLAFSADGRRFTRLPAAESPYGRAGLVLTARDALPGVGPITVGVVADPDVVLRNGVFHMWFSSFACGGGCTPDEVTAFGIGHATSHDGVHWTAARDNPVPSLRNAAGSGGQQPTVTWNPNRCRFEMWFTNDGDREKAAVPTVFSPAFGFWRATSPDGETWNLDYTAGRDFTWRRRRPSERWGIMTGGEVVIRGNRIRMYYSAFGSVRIPNPQFVVPVNGGVSAAGFVPGTLGLSLAARAAGPSRSAGSCP